tara:strand:+ start:8837 stop:9592 length:756 start_codon:yes stop_codon:yes gene_type:complete
MLIAFAVGVIIFFTPSLIIPYIPIKQRLKVANFYYRLATRFYDRLLFLQRKHGALALYPSQFDQQLQSEWIKLGKKSKAHFEDVYGCIGYLNEKPVLFADERTNCLFNPPLADVATRFKEMVYDKKHIHVFDETSEKPITAYCSYVAVPNSFSLVNLRNWISLVPGSASPFLCSTTDEYVRLSQQKYHKNKTIEAMVALTFFAAGFAAVAGVLYLTKGQYTQAITQALPVWAAGCLSCSPYLYMLPLGRSL